VTAPGPSRLLALARTPLFRRNELAGFRYGWRTHGDLYHVQLGSRDLWICSHPDQVHEVLVSGRETWRRIDEFPPGRPFGLKLALGDGLLTTDGEEWQWRRRIINPAFHRSRIEAMVATMASAGRGMLDRLDEAAAADEPLDLLVEMKRVTQEIISRTMFSADISADADRIGAAVDESLRFVARRARALVNLPPEWPTRAARRFHDSVKEMDRVIYGIIRERRESDDPGDDLLGMLLQATDEETGRSLSDDQVRNEVATVYGAGHETTANALTWAWHELMQNPEILERLQTEVDAAGEMHNTADLTRLPYTRMVFDETLRLRPPVPINGRLATAPTKLGDFRADSQAIALLVVNNVHRHPDFWERPDEFYPDHFTPEAKESRHRYAWAPFGAGPHLCIGNNFATTEGVLLLAQMASRFTFQPVRPLPRPPALAVTLKPRGGLPVRVMQRA
jgi:cytochrome P450